MSQTIDLKELERRAFLAYHQDGLLDIFGGLLALTAGLWIAADMFFMVGSAVAVFLPLWMLAKKSVTIPRIGYVKFSPARTAAIQKIVGMLVALTVLAVVLTTGLWLGHNVIPLAWLAWLEGSLLLIMGVMGAIIIVAVAFLSGMNRLYVYAVLTVGVFAGGQWLNLPVWLNLVVLGALVTLSGFVILIRFVRRYPIAAESADGNP